MKRKRLFKLAAGFISVTMLLQVAVLPVWAAENDTVTYSDIVQKAGNDEMKEYGTAIEKNKNPQVKDTVPESGVSGTTYYISPDGDDNAAGTSESTAWKTVEKVNAQTFQPGDRILFEAGGEWIAPTPSGEFFDDDNDGRPEEFLAPKGSGTADNYIVLGAYGTGALPKLIGDSKVNSVISLKDQEYWDISNLDVSNFTDGFDPKNTGNAANAEKMGNLRGIQIYGQDKAGVLNGYKLHDLYVHDVSGYVYWGGSPATRGYYGVAGMMGNDASKRTGGIVFEVWKPTTETDMTLEEQQRNDNDKPITFNDIHIYNNVICDTSFGGITVKQWSGSGHNEVNTAQGFHSDAVEATNEMWHRRVDASNSVDTNKPTAENGYKYAGFHPHTNVYIEDNYVSNNNTEYGCNTIRVQSVAGGLVENNVCSGSGTCAIELDYSDDIVVQYNEVYDTKKKMGGADNNAIDTDAETTNCLIQYNYVHENGDGFLLCGIEFSTAVYRYNVIKNSGSGDHYIAIYGDKGVNTVLNNLVYTSNKASSFVGVPGGKSSTDNANNPIYYVNNIFYNASDGGSAPAMYQGKYSYYSNNAYYGTTKSNAPKAPSSDTNAITEDISFTGDFDADLNNIEAFTLSDKSPLIDSGAEEIIYPDNFGGTFVTQYLINKDFFGNETPSNKAAVDIGVSEYQFENGEGILRGYVTDRYGNKAVNATVAIEYVSGSDTIPPLSAFAEKLTIEKKTNAEDNIRLVITAKNGEELPAMVTLYAAVYDGQNVLKRVVPTVCAAHDDAIIVPITEPTIETGEAYKLMLWTVSQEPIISAITDLTGFTGGEATLDHVTTNENGYYSFGAIATGSYELSVTKTNYENSEAVSAEVTAGKVTESDLTLGESLLNTGLINGTIQSGGAPVAGAAVTLTCDDDESVNKTTTSDDDGSYNFEAEADKTYTVTVTKDGYKDRTVGDITVQKGNTHTVDITLISSDYSSTEYIINEDFNSYNTGSFTGNDIWTVYGDTNNNTITIEDDTENESNKYLKINKTGSSNTGDRGIFNTDNLNLSGTVSFEARVKRTNDSGQYNQFSIYSYHQNDWSGNSPKSGSTPIVTAALLKSGDDRQILTHYHNGDARTTTILSSYELNEWYTLRCVANLDTKTFDFYVNDMDNPVISGEKLGNQSRDVLDKFLIYSGAGNQGDLLVDYFRVCSGMPYDTDDASLKDILVNGVEAVKTEGEDKYTIVAPYSAEKLTILPEAQSIFAKLVMIDGQEVPEGGVEVEFPDATLTKSITVTAEDDTTKTYELVIIRSTADEDSYTTLSGIKVNGISAEQKDDYTYEVTLEELDDGMVSILPVSSTIDFYTKVLVNGIECADSAYISPVNLEMTENPMVVTVTVTQDNLTKKYMLTINSVVSTNLLKNGSFEDEGKVTAPSSFNWNLNYVGEWAYANATYPSTEHSAGEKSVRLGLSQTAGDSQDKIGYLTQKTEQKLTAGTTYVLEADIKGSGNVILKFEDGSQNYPDSSPKETKEVTATDDWARYSLEYTPTSDLTCVIMIQTKTAGDIAYIDNVTLTEKQE